MTPRMFQVIAIMAAVALAGALGLTVIAMSNDSGAPQAGLLGHLHRLGEHLHGAHGHHDPMAELIEQLELTPEQRGRIEKIHSILGGAHGGRSAEDMQALHERLMRQLEQGNIDDAEIRLMIDGHVEQMRTLAYSVSDELISLINGLDDRQRGILLEHLRAAGL